MRGGLLVPIGDAATFEVVRGQFDLDLVAGQDADVVHAHLPGDVGENLMAIVQLDAEHGIGEGLGDGALHDDRIFL